MTTTVLTPEQVESRLIALGRELDDAHTSMVDAEHTYYTAKAGYEIRLAEARLAVGEKYASRGVKVTVQEREDEALMKVRDELRALYDADATVRASRANLQRVRTQIDIARSVGTTMRAFLDVTT